MALKNKFALFLLFLTSALVHLAPGLAQAPKGQIFDLDRWITYYYLRPEPNLTVAAILEMSERGYFDKASAQAPFVAFFAQLFAQNPQSIQPWFSKLRNLPQHHKRTLWTALWYSATAEGIAQLKFEAQNVDKAEKENLLKTTITVPPSLATIEITSPAVLDMLWASFMATGDTQYVVRIISTLPWSDQKEDVTKLVIGGSARWSLTSNCIQHQKVLELCKAEVTKQGDSTSRILKEVVKQAEARKQ